jgi:hypothetical protein
MGPRNKDASATLLVMITFGFDISSSLRMGADPRYVHEPGILQMNFLSSLDDRFTKQKAVNRWFVKKSLICTFLAYLDTFP